ncbi:MAG TPA: RNA polymerase sigma factor region1.1 domain-containing protein, partial [Pirellulales bacterium]
MDHVTTDLNELVAKGKTQGYLTYDEVNAYLPDEAVNPEKLDNLLMALDEAGIELLTDPPADSSQALESLAAHPAAEESLAMPAGELPKLSDDPVRMYLSQMAIIPLLTREQEISLAKKIEVTRKRFRRSVLGCNFAMQVTIDTLEKVYQGVLPFDRTIKVSLTERLTKDQILARMPHNLKTLGQIRQHNRDDFRRLVRRSTSRTERLEARKRFCRRRRKALQLVEELSLRTRRVQPLVKQLREFSQRMDFVRRRMNELAHDPDARDEWANFRKELRSLMMLTWESPRSLRNRLAVVNQQFQDYEHVKRQLSSGNLRLVVSIA